MYYFNGRERDIARIKNIILLDNDYNTIVFCNKKYMSKVQNIDDKIEITINREVCFTINKSFSLQIFIHISWIKIRKRIFFY